ncbi:hypothetical protein BGX31_003639, partial [Mortierella sp. GBA43]
MVLSPVADFLVRAKATEPMNFLQELYKEFSSVNSDDILQMLEDAAQEVLRVHPDNTRVKAYSNKFR